MSVVATMFVISILCIIAGLVIIMLSPKATPPVMATVAWWIGALVFVAGVVLFVAPIVIWVREQLVNMLGIH